MRNNYSFNCRTLELRVLCLAIGLLVLVSCQPQVVLVEVTRIVESIGDDADIQSTAAIPTIHSEATLELVEVTRIVSQEVTRIVTNTVAHEVLQEIEVEVTRPPVGAIERPIQILIPAAFDTDVTSRRGQPLVDALAEATGTNLETGSVDGESDAIELLCAAPEDTIAIVSAMAFVLANEQCDVQLGNVAIRDDELAWEFGMMVARRDSGISSLSDLAGKRWAVPEGNGIPQNLYFQSMLMEQGIELPAIVEVPSDNSAMLAVYNGDVDVASATYVPPILPFSERLWEYGEDSPEVWRRVGISPRRSPIGYVLVNGEPEFGGYRLRDARSGIIDIAPDIYDQTQVIAISAPIPNHTVVFGAKFPLAVAREVVSSLEVFASSDLCTTSLCSADFYGWMGLEPAVDSIYDPLRTIVEALNLAPEALLRP